MTTPIPTVPGIIRRLRRHADLSQRAFADLVGVSKATVAAWEAGRSSPSFAHALALAEVAGLRITLTTHDGVTIPPMREDAVRDLAHRYYPAHADPYAGVGPSQIRLGRTKTGVTFDLGVWRRFWRGIYGTPDDHPTPVQLFLAVEEGSDVDERIAGVDDRRLVPTDDDPGPVRPHEPQRLPVGVEERPEPIPLGDPLPQVRLQVEDPRAPGPDPAA